MSLSRTGLIALATAGSALLLFGAFAFQHLGGLAPCPMCLWQRYPHAAALALGLLALLVSGAVARRGLAALGALAALSTAAIGIYHTGVERGWWDGPDTCTAPDISNMSSQDLLAQIMAAPLVRCDEVAWDFLGLSMASWNAVLSLGLAAIWLAAALRRS